MIRAASRLQRRPPVRRIGLVLLLAAAPARGQVGDPQLETDHVYFPGEGAMSTPARAVKMAMSAPRGTLGGESGRDKLIRLFLWRAEHYAHLWSPAVYNLPGLVPNPRADHPLMTDLDSMRALFSYGFGLCGTNHAQMRPFVETLGWAGRTRALVGDTGYEVLVDGGWRYFNSDQYTLHFLEDSPTAHFASLDQVISTPHRYIEWNPDVGLGHRLPQANTHGGYQDVTGVTGIVRNRALQWRDYYRNVWRPLAGGNWRMYADGYTATPIVYRVRRGESFTRWLDGRTAAAELGLAGPAFWGYNAGNTGGGDNGPFARWSFVQNAPARDEIPGAPEESEGRQRWGNGAFDWRPDLARGEHLDGAAAVTGNLAAGGEGLRAAGPATLVLEQFTPYTIAARPLDGKDPAQPAADGAVLWADAVGTVEASVSVDAGATWAAVGSLTGAGARLDFTDAVKGRNQYLLRLAFDDGEGLRTLRLRTLTMVSQGVYPNLKEGGSRVSYAAGNVGALELSPNLFTAEAAASKAGYARKVGDSGNLAGVHYADRSTFAFDATNNQPLSVTYEVTLPPQLAARGAAWRDIHAAASFAVSVPPAAGSWGRIEIAPAADGPWTKIAEYEPPLDNELSAFWVYGVGRAAGNGRTVFVRFTTRNGGRISRIRFLRLFGTYTQPAAPGAVEVTYAWNDGGERMHTHLVRAGATAESWTVPTGARVAQRKVVIRVPSGGAAPAAGAGSAPPSDGGAASPARDGGAGPTGAGPARPDAGAGTVPAPAPGPASVPAGDEDADDEAIGGCACRTGGRAPHGPGLAAIVLAGALALGRGRRRRVSSR